MALISEGRFIADRWHHADAPDAASPLVIVPLAEANAQTAGILVPNTLREAECAPLLHAALIGVSFPAFTDGRGFSIGRLLRRAGFRGELRACGNLIPDQYAALLACGFDTVEISDERAARQGEADWRAAFEARHETYQRGYVTAGSILEQRRAAR